MQNWSFNHRKPQKTAVDWSMMVLVQFFEYLRKGRQVAVSVLSSIGKKLDCTRLLSTKYDFKYNCLLKNQMEYFECIYDYFITALGFVYSFNSLINCWTHSWLSILCLFQTLIKQGSTTFCCQQIRPFLIFN